MATRKRNSILDSIRRGDRVTIVNRFGQERTGKAVMRGPHGWVLNMGGRYGTPAVATEGNIVKVGSRRNAGRGSFRKTKKQLRKKGVTMRSSKRRKHTIKKSFEGTGRSAESLLAWGPGSKWRRANLPRAKGRKVKGGRAVSLRNFTGTIVRKSDGTVNILGRGRKR